MDLVDHNELSCLSPQKRIGVVQATPIGRAFQMPALRNQAGPNQALRQAAVSAVELLKWKNSEGQIFTGCFYPPVLTKPDQPAPLFITYYVCPGYQRSGYGDEWPLASLAGAGIAALCINHPYYEGADQDALAEYRDDLSGVRSIVAILHKRGLIDPTSVGMGGLSFGSEVTLWTAMRARSGRATCPIGAATR